MFFKELSHTIIYPQCTLAIHIPIFFRLYFDNTLTWMRFEVMHIFQNWSFTPICYVHPVLLLFFFFFSSQNQQYIFPFGNDDFPTFTVIFQPSLLAYYSFISCTVLNLIHPLWLGWIS